MLRNQMRSVAVILISLKSAPQTAEYIASFHCRVLCSKMYLFHISSFHFSLNEGRSL